jgi:hypothetical protein
MSQSRLSVQDFTRRSGHRLASGSFGSVTDQGSKSILGERRSVKRDADSSGTPSRTHASTAASIVLTSGSVLSMEYTGDVSKQIPKLITLMSKQQLMDQETGADQALLLQLKNVTHIIKSNEVRKIRIALESTDKVVHGILHLLAALVQIGKRIR